MLRSEVCVAAYLYDSLPLCVTNVNQIYCVCLLLCHCFPSSNTGCYCIVGLHIPQLEERCIFQLVLWWRMVYSCAVNYCSGVNNGRSLRLLRTKLMYKLDPLRKGSHFLQCYIFVLSSQISGVKDVKIIDRHVWSRVGLHFITIVFLFL